MRCGHFDNLYPLARHFKKPFAVTARGSDINLIANHAIPRKFMRWAASYASASIGVSKALTIAMERMDFSSARLKTLPNGVDLRQFNLLPQSAARKELNWPEQPTLLCVGNLVENKGQSIAIEALTKLTQFRLVIAGEGPQRGTLENLVSNANLASRVQFLGRIDQSMLAKCYCASDILVLPSSREGWPNVLLESMACGTPVVATRVGGIPEIVTSSNAGTLMLGRTSAELVDAVNNTWATLPKRENVRACAEGSSWHATTVAQVFLFRDIVSSRQGKPHA